MKRGNSSALLAAGMMLTFGYVSALSAGQWDLGGSAAAELRYFANPPQFPAQDKTAESPTGVINPILTYESDDSRDRINLNLYTRFDANDENRTHNDIREANWVHLADDWDILIGVSKVFWGVTEAAHLVDIINQTDTVEGVSGEEKLGQAMINLNLESEWGSLSLFVLPGFRDQIFTETDSRLHGSFPVDTSLTKYEASDGKQHTDWAVSWADTLDDLDISLSYFNGTSREPSYVLQGAVLAPYYAQITQTGLTLQLTTENTLWKAEAISRTGLGEQFYAAVGGFEHTLYGVTESGADLGLILEYLYDGRDPTTSPPSAADNDLFMGVRMAMNDTTDTVVLAGVMSDLDSGTALILMEAGRRLTDRIKVTLNSYFFVNVDDNDPLAFIQDDDHVELKLNWYF